MKPGVIVAWEAYLIVLSIDTDGTRQNQSQRSDGYKKATVENDNGGLHYLYVPLAVVGGHFMRLLFMHARCRFGVEPRQPTQKEDLANIRGLSDGSAQVNRC